MKFIAKSKTKRSYKAVNDIADFHHDEFDEYDLYRTEKIDPDQFGDIVKMEKIRELKMQLAELGVDLNSIGVRTPPPPYNAPPLTHTPTSQQTNEDGSFKSIDELQQESSEVSTPASKIGSQIANPVTGQPYTLNEIQQVYDKFKEKIERDIQEIMFSSYDETGIILTLSETVNGIPKMLSNGIPIHIQMYDHQAG